VLFGTAIVLGASPFEAANFRMAREALRRIGLVMNRLV
jgi:hypothetical protein